LEISKSGEYFMLTFWFFLVTVQSIFPFYCRRI